MAVSTKESLDVLLAYAQQHEISTVRAKSEVSLDACHFPYHRNAVMIGPFAMQVHCHDTGNSVRVYVIGAGKPYRIMDATFWKRPGYEHNADSIEHGAWDAAFADAQKALAKMVADHKADEEHDRLQVAQRQENINLARKAEVEKLFLK